jgi:ATP-dependent HslUV protease ATP-binding subunit HslU
VDGVDVSFSEGAISEIARLAHEVNEKTHNIGARRLQTMMEVLLQEFLYAAPESSIKKLEVDEKLVRSKLEGYVANVERMNVLV